MNRAATILLLVALLVGAASALESPRADISVDGNASEWQGISSQPIADSSSSFSEPPAQDLSATFKTAWDEQRLYAYFEVSDDEYDVTGGEYTFENDGIELMIDGGNEKSTSYDSNDYKIIVQADGGGQRLWRDGLSAVSGDDVTASATRSDDGYVLEVGVRWSLVGQAPTGGETVGFDAAVNDRDDEEYQHYLMWQYADEHPHDTSNWDELRLVAPSATCGDGEREGGERCDDGNDVDTDFCSNACTVNANAHSGFRFREDTVTYAESETSKDLGVRVDDTAVYDTGYYSLDGGVSWEEFTLSGPSIGENWVLTRARNNLTLARSAVDTSNRKLVATYSCTWSDEWDCHGGGWQIKEFTVSFQEPAESVCGDGVIDEDEDCDGSALGGETCTSQGFDGGTLSCDPDLCVFETNSCTNEAVCGNGVVEEGEACDGADLDGNTCASEGFDGGTLACNPDTCELDTSSCEEYVCGNGVKEPGEACDGDDLNGATCTDRGYTGGSLSCTGSCTYDENACTGATFQDSKSGDEDALQALYEAANGDSWNDNTGWSFSGMDLNDDIHGVSVEEIGGELRVTEIDLRLNGLTGSIDVPQIGNLKELELFSVYLNELDSSIPEELMGLANNNLRYLYLSLADSAEELRELHPHEATLTGGGRIHPGKNKHNEENVFRGTLHAPPDPQNAVLEWLYVSWTDTDELAEDGIDRIEPGIFEIPTMIGIQLYENTGVGAAGNYMEFPDLRVMPNLRIWTVGGGTGTNWDEDRHGYFTGEVGDKVEGLSELIELGLSRHGQLTVDFDETDLSGLTEMTMFGATGTNVRGSLPEYFFDGTLPRFQTFGISWPKNSGMTGELPEFTGNVNLKVFRVTDHDFSGPIPASFWESYPEMINTNFGYNRFTSIGTDDLTHLGGRSSWWQIRNLRWYNNEISGPWPKLAWGTSQLDKFTRFRVNDNRYVFRDMLYVPDNAPNGETIFELMQQEADKAFSYSPQKPFGEPETITVSSGDDVVLDMFTGDVSHADNEYQWERDGSAVSGGNSRALTLNNVDGGDEGTYRLIVDNPNVPRLTLQSEPVELAVN